MTGFRTIKAVIMIAHNISACYCHISVSTRRKRFADFLFINSSVRGPLLPWHAARQHWTRMFTQKLNDHVKLVGPAISCEHFCLMEKAETSNAMRRKECRKNAHVQSVAVATDQACPFPCLHLDPSIAKSSRQCC